MVIRQSIKKPRFMRWDEWKDLGGGVEEKVEEMHLNRPQQHVVQGGGGAVVGEKGRGLEMNESRADFIGEAIIVGPVGEKGLGRRGREVGFKVGGEVVRGRS